MAGFGSTKSNYPVLGIYRNFVTLRFCRRNFASSMGNISFFFPKAKQGSALGINGGLGNLGVSVMQLVSPILSSCRFLPFWAFAA